MRNVNLIDAYIYILCCLYPYKLHGDSFQFVVLIYKNTNPRDPVIDKNKLNPLPVGK